MAKPIKTIIVDCYSLEQKKQYIENLLKKNGSRYYRVKMLKENNDVRNMICGKPERKTIKGTGHALKANTDTVRVTESFVGNRSWNMLRTLELKMSGVLYQFRFKNV